MKIILDEHERLALRVLLGDTIKTMDPEWPEHRRLTTLYNKLAKPKEKESCSHWGMI